MSFCMTLLRNWKGLSGRAGPEGVLLALRGPPHGRSGQCTGSHPFLQDQLKAPLTFVPRLNPTD